MTQDVITFGCRLNTYESEVIRQGLAASGRENVVVFNTCAVTKEAERQARQAIRKYKREHPLAEVIVTGCAAQINPAAYAGLPEVDKVLGNKEKLEPESYRVVGGESIVVSDIMQVKETASHLISGLEGRARAFLEIQNGCNHRCTFCIIPFGRGNNRSVPIGQVVETAKKLVASGYNEIVLTGVDISDYGQDLPGTPTLGQMIRRLLRLVPELPRLRLSSIDVAEIDADLHDLIINEPKLMPHLHLSLQSGDDMILKRMKRRHLRQDVLDFCHDVRGGRPDVVFGADIIAGFPTETDTMFENTLDIVKKAGLTWLHVFPYSPREGTPAARMPQVPGKTRKSRAAVLRALGEQQVQTHLAAQVGKTHNILVEKENIGRTEQFTPVRFEGKAPVGHIIPIRIMGWNDTELLGRII